MANNEKSEDAGITIEILHGRHPDYSCELTVFVNGERFERFVEVDLDPGAGVPRSDWEENKATDTAKGTDAFRAAVAAAYEAFDNNPYIMEGY